MSQVTVQKPQHPNGPRGGFIGNLSMSALRARVASETAVTAPRADPPTERIEVSARRGLTDVVDG